MTISISDDQHKRPAQKQCHYAEYRYAEYRVFYCYAECRYAECRGVGTIAHLPQILG